MDILDELGVRGLRTRDLASWFLRLRGDTLRWKQIVNIDAPSALIVADFLQQHLKDSDERLALMGGEATIWLGSYDGKEIAIREIHLPEEGWSSPAGQRTLKVILREIVTHWQLHHPNILTLFGVFREVDSDPPMMVLPFVPHGSALGWLKSNNTPECFLNIILDIARGLAYLHEQNPPIIHGDLHPSNVLIDEQGEALLCDFGLSRIRYEVTRTYTDIRSGGRIAYLAPELLAGPDRYRTTEASDVYAMAMMFVALGTLLPPFHGVVVNELKLSSMIQDGLRPAAPTTLGNLPLPSFRELWSLMQSMWASAEQRSLNSRQVYTMLSQLASGSPVDAAGIQERDSESPKIALNQETPAPLVAPAAESIDSTQSARGKLFKLLPGVGRLIQNQKPKKIQGHSDSVTSVAFSPDGKRIISGSDDKTLRLWDAELGKAIGEPFRGHSGWTRFWGWVHSVAFSPDGKRIVSGSDDETLRLWDAESGESIGEPMRGHSGDVSSVAFSPDGKRIVSGSYDKTLRLWDAESGEAIGEPLQGHSGWVRSVAFSPDGKYIVSGSNDRTLRLWDAESGRAIGEPMRGHSGWSSLYGWVNSVAFSPDGKRIVSGCDDETIRLWDAESGEAIGEPLRGHSSEVTSVAFSPDGKHIVSGAFDNTVRLWDVESGRAIGEPLRGHSGTVRSVAFSPDGKRIVSGSNDKTLRLWNAESGAAIGEPL